MWSSHEAGIRITLHAPSFLAAWFLDHGPPSLRRFLCVSCACSYPQDRFASIRGAIVFTSHSHLCRGREDWQSIASVLAHRAR